MFRFQVNADMNSDILHTAAIFYLTNFYLKQGIDKVYVMVDFICMGYLQLQGAEAIFTKWDNQSFLC